LQRQPQHPRLPRHRHLRVPLRLQEVSSPPGLSRRRPRPGGAGAAPSPRAHQGCLLWPRARGRRQAARVSRWETACGNPLTISFARFYRNPM
jgi:hypothetical protein